MNRPRRLAILGRITWTVASLCVEQMAVCALAIFPVALLWTQVLTWVPHAAFGRVAVVSLLLAPSYVLFALCLMLVSGLTVRAMHAGTTPDLEMRISDYGWPLLRWARHMVRLHIVRVFSGALFRGSPMWTAYLRLNGARIGRRVYVNTMFLSDYNLLEFGDDVVIGAEAHISGHTVEGGIVKTGRVRFGPNVTIGLGSVVEIGVDIRANTQIGALSFVPKRTSWPGGAVYAGIPIRRLEASACDSGESPPS
jgi:acetyltransferase-like isoleucine patch superfamily enzyme